MTDRIVVFLGPTLERDRAEAILDAIYLPPVEQGAVVRAVKTYEPRVLVLIDGAFARVPAVRHKEILWALSRGVLVFGAASMGALRAAELFGFGMQGHGLIYRWYRATPLADDDEVAVAMTPSSIGAHPLSDALINIRLTLRRAERAGLVRAHQRRSLEDIARGIHFVDRTFAHVFARARASWDEEWRQDLPPLERWIAENAVDQKRNDAVGLLEKLATGMTLPPRAGEIASFRWTEALIDDLDAAGIEAE